ncbi:N(alpha)-acetyltransferase 20, NatB catalytic subunit [Globodera pallida]|uniref:N-alpha-acetyltransferase 20 n=1 Tax=Globodera pallida TaxID=36090 RepID=A0A183BLM2_GLOPA|nr:N(alpha)-acetyltransferase 20, NatB catalytic subunit [Globodera pallida]
MTTYRPFEPFDLFRVSTVNLDPLTETYGLPFYLHYLINWPEYFMVAEHLTDDVMGYIMGKAEGRDQNWHGHVTAVTVGPEYRRMGLAANFMQKLEEISKKKNCFFVDLFVRISNETAVNMYRRLGYTVYRRITEYYSGDGTLEDEDAFDMRKALPRDADKKSIIPLKHPVSCDEIEFD